MAKNDGWRPEYDEVKDIMRPYEASDDTTQPEGGAPEIPEGERDWRAKRAEEDRQQLKSKARSRRRIWPGVSLGGKAGPKKKKKRGAALARLYRMRVAAQLAPYAALLLLAPYVSGPGGFYLLVLLTAVPATAAALLLRPLGPKAWTLRALTPLLPLEAHFALRYFAWNPGGALALASAFALSGSLYYIFGLRGRGPGKDTPKPETRNSQLELELKGRRQARRTRSDDEKQAAKGHSRRFLLFVVPLMCVSLLIPALLGFGMQLRRPQAGAMPQRSEAYLTQRMEEAYTDMLPGVWGSLGRADREAALQTLLDTETDNLKIPRYRLRDPAVLSIGAGQGGSVAALLLSGKDKTELRVTSVCRLAWRLRQLHIAQEADLDSYEADADAYARSRYIAYVELWEGGSHAG